MTVISPCDYEQARQAVRYASQIDTPVYIRSSRIDVPCIYDKDYEFNPNKAEVLEQGDDVTLISTGDIFSEVILAGEILKQKGINAEIINVPVIKPLDSKTILDSLKKTSLAVVVENHSVIGGLGSAVCEITAEKSPHKVVRIGINDTFGQSGTPKELLKFYKLDAESIAEKVIELKNDTIKSGN